jgi:hypothetical protein
LAVDLGDRLLCIRLYAAWDTRHAAAATLEAFARRLGDFIVQRYGDPSR